jgi:hypothetical protein
LGIRAFQLVLYHKPETRKMWKDANCSSCQEGRSLYSSILERSKFGFGRFFLKGPELVLEGFVLERPSSSSKESSHD